MVLRLAHQLSAVIFSFGILLPSFCHLSFRLGSATSAGSDESYTDES